MKENKIINIIENKINSLRELEKNSLEELGNLENQINFLRQKILAIRGGIAYLEETLDEINRQNKGEQK